MSCYLHAQTSRSERREQLEIPRGPESWMEEPPIEVSIYGKEYSQFMETLSGGRQRNKALIALSSPTGLRLSFEPS